MTDAIERILLNRRQAQWTSNAAPNPANLVFEASLAGVPDPARAEMIRILHDKYEIDATVESASPTGAPPNRNADVLRVRNSPAGAADATKLQAAFYLADPANWPETRIDRGQGPQPVRSLNLSGLSPRQGGYAAHILQTLNVQHDILPDDAGRPGSIAVTGANDIARLNAALPTFLPDLVERKIFSDEAEWTRGFSQDPAAPALSPNIPHARLRVADAPQDQRDEAIRLLRDKYDIAATIQSIADVDDQGNPALDAHGNPVIVDFLRVQGADIAKLDAVLHVTNPANWNQDHVLQPGNLTNEQLIYLMDVMHHLGVPLDVQANPNGGPTVMRATGDANIARLRGMMPALQRVQPNQQQNPANTLPNGRLVPDTDPDADQQQNWHGNGLAFLPHHRAAIMRIGRGLHIRPMENSPTPNHYHVYHRQPNADPAKPAVETLLFSIRPHAIELFQHNAADNNAGILEAAKLSVAMWGDKIKLVDCPEAQKVRMGHALRHLLDAGELVGPDGVPLTRVRYNGQYIIGANDPAAQAQAGAAARAAQQRANPVLAP